MLASWANNLILELEVKPRPFSKLISPQYSVETAGTSDVKHLYLPGYSDRLSVANMYARKLYFRFVFCDN
jgi:hypothetical protein